MHTQTLAQLIQGLQSKSFSSVELVTHYIDRINAAKHLNAFINLDFNHALVAAKEADKMLQQNKSMPLTGIPIAHKDNFCTTSLPTTCASKMLADFQSPYNATIVERLATAGTILMGKTNMDEFAMGSSNETSFFGPVKNPWNNQHVAGGSSGGSAASVAARLIPFATGSDTGGSIRQPAAFCGITGLKPTYGLVSRYGMVAYASSLDQAGLFTQNAKDMAIALQYMAGYDEKDSTSIERSLPDFSKDLEKPINPIKIGLPTCFFKKEVHQDIQDALKRALKLFEDAGAIIEEIDLPLQSLWSACYYVISSAEAASNLARFDGIRYGYRAANASSIQELITRSRSEGLGSQVKRRILTGNYILSSANFDAYYVHAKKVRRMISDELQQHFAKFDIILGPTTPTCAFKIGEPATSTSNDIHLISDLFTIAANLSGIPALSIPIGKSNGLPIGMQIMGNYFSEARLLQVANFYQQATDWHLSIPALGENL